MLELLDECAPIAAIYASSYITSRGNFSWRKPGPGLLLQAATDMSLDLSLSIVVDDRLTDIQAGVAAGLKFMCHVLAGHGKKERIAVRKYYKELQYRKDLLPPRISLFEIDALQSFPYNLLLRGSVNADRRS